VSVELSVLPPEKLNSARANLKSARDTPFGAGQPADR
jgi:hypothetical protein